MILTFICQCELLLEIMSKILIIHCFHSDGSQSLSSCCHSSESGAETPGSDRPNTPWVNPNGTEEKVDTDDAGINRDPTNNRWGLKCKVNWCQSLVNVRVSVRSSRSSVENLQCVKKRFQGVQTGSAESS